MTPLQADMLLRIGMALSVEREPKRLLEQILSDTMELSGCDAGALYLRDGDVLRFTVVRSNSLGVFLGGRGESVDLPPISLDTRHICSAALLYRRTIHLQDASKASDYDLFGPLNRECSRGYEIGSALAVPMENREGDCIGVLQLVNALGKDGEVVPFSGEILRMVESVASQTGLAIENMNYVKAVGELFHSFVEVMSTAIDERTPYNATHTRNMVRYGERFMDYINELSTKKTGRPRLGEAHRQEIIMSIWLHDIGKLITPLEIMNKASRLEGRMEQILRRFDVILLTAKVEYLSADMSREEFERVEQEIREAAMLIQYADGARFLPETILEEIRGIGKRRYMDTDGAVKNWLTNEELESLMIRRGTLTEQERLIMENHVEMTKKLLSRIRFSKDYEHVPEWASGHHEYLNGTGYPKGLSGDQIPYEVRMITILDIFDALTASDRPYKEGMPVGRALKILWEMAEYEGKLDRDLTAQFIESRCWENGPLN